MVTHYLLTCPLTMQVLEILSDLKMLLIYLKSHATRLNLHTAYIQIRSKNPNTSYVSVRSHCDLSWQN